MKDKAIDLAALAVAICALWLSIRQVDIQRRLEITNKQPLLTIEFIKIDSLPEKGFKISNAGFGPAIITSFMIYNNLNEKKGSNKWIEENAPDVRFGNPDNISFYEINNLTKDFVIATGKENELFLLGTKSRNFYNSVTSKNMSNVIIEVKYKSISHFDDQEYCLRFSENSAINNRRSTADKQE